MRKQLDALNEKLSTINWEIQNKSQQKEQRLQVKLKSINLHAQFLWYGWPQG